MKDCLSSFWGTCQSASDEVRAFFDERWTVIRDRLSTLDDIVILGFKDLMYQEADTSSGKRSVLASIDDQIISLTEGRLAELSSDEATD
jgi:hypothetical protein